MEHDLPRWIERISASRSSMIRKAASRRDLPQKWKNLALRRRITPLARRPAAPFRSWPRASRRSLNSTGAMAMEAEIRNDYTWPAKREPG